jgi:hypothetical protein
MKKKDFGIFGIAVVGAAMVFNTNISLSSSTLSDVALANVEALAQKEDAKPYESVTEETQACLLNLGGGWFTNSVEIVCVVRGDGVYSSCTPVPCGVPF